MDIPRLNRIDQDELRKIFERGYLLDDDHVILYNVCSIVFTQYYSDRLDIKDDLIQEGMLGLVRFMYSKKYDRSKSPLNAAYTYVRNSMQDFISSTMKGYYADKVAMLNEKSPDHEKHFDMGNISDREWYRVPTEVVDNISLFVDDRLKEHKLNPTLRYYVKAYFSDKLGIKYKPDRIRSFTLDIVEKYRYYVNLIEYELFNKFLGGKVFDNSVHDILDVLETKGEVDFFMKRFMNSLSKEQVLMLLYVFSGNGFKMPSKFSLLKVDTYLTIYKTVVHGGISTKVAAKIFDKSVSSIEAIIDNYSKVFVDTEDTSMSEILRIVNDKPTDAETELFGNSIDIDDLENLR